MRLKDEENFPDWKKNRKIKLLIMHRVSPLRLFLLFVVAILIFGMGACRPGHYPTHHKSRAKKCNCPSFGQNPTQRVLFQQPI